MCPVETDAGVRNNNDVSEQKRIAILGSTGSIGTQTLDIIDEHPELFKATVLTAARNWQLIAKQAVKYGVERVVIADQRFESDLTHSLAGSGIKVSSGLSALCEAAESDESDVVMGALVGYAGLSPTLHAARAGKVICLANKETLVAGGLLVTKTVREHGAKLIPVDSEHSAIFQCLVGEHRPEVSKLILTASGGPFRTKSKEELQYVGVADALNHPNWKMGAKVTVDSASMMNKGFEMIEARWLFDCPAERIEVVVHPQSIVHSMVEFIDGSVKAQLGVPDMRTPIRYALSYPHRIESKQRPLKLSEYSNLTFEAPDLEKFPLLGMAYAAIERGGTATCALNAANEIAVGAFLDGKLRFCDMADLTHRAMERASFTSQPDYDDLIATDSEVRAIATEELSYFTDKH